MTVRAPHTLTHTVWPRHLELQYEKKWAYEVFAAMNTYIFVCVFVFFYCARSHNESLPNMFPELLLPRWRDGLFLLSNALIMRFYNFFITAR